MVRAFLNEPTIEAAHKKYLQSWRKPTVQQVWNGRKPSLKQFQARFGKSYEARQNWLSKRREGDDTVAVLEDERLDHVQDVAEVLNDLQALSERILGKSDPVMETWQGKARADAEDEAASQAEVEAEADLARTVKPENMGALPTVKQIYFYLHRAIEAGEDLAFIPVTRGVAAHGRSLMAEGKSYKATLTALKRGNG